MNKRLIELNYLSNLEKNRETREKKTRELIKECKALMLAEELDDKKVDKVIARLEKQRELVK